MLPGDCLSVNRYFPFFNFAETGKQMEAKIWVSSWWVIVPNSSMRVLSDHLSRELPLNIVGWPRYWTFVSCFLPLFWNRRCTFNSEMIGNLGGSSSGLIFLAIFTSKVQPSDFFFSPPKGRLPEAAYLVLVMLANHRNISILDEKAMKVRGWKLSNPYGLQYTPLGRACGLWLFKRKKGKRQQQLS